MLLDLGAFYLKWVLFEAIFDEKDEAWKLITPITVSGVIVTAGANSPVSTDDTILSLSYGFFQADLDAAILAEQQKWDANGDGQIGLEEAIRALQVISGVEW